MMIQCIVNTEEKIVEIVGEYLSEDFENLCKRFKGYKFLLPGFPKDMK